MKTRRLNVRRDFKLRRSHLDAWANDVRDSVLAYFEAANATPLLCPGTSVTDKARRALMRSFRRKGERATFAASVPRSARAIALDLRVEPGSPCANCGEASKTLESRIAFVSRGGVVRFDGKPRTTTGVCPACGAAQEEEGPPAPDEPESSVLRGMSEL